MRLTARHTRILSHILRGAGSSVEVRSHRVELDWKAVCWLTQRTPNSRSSSLTHSVHVSHDWHLTTHSTLRPAYIVRF